MLLAFNNDVSADWLTAKRVFHYQNKAVFCVGYGATFDS